MLSFRGEKGTGEVTECVVCSGGKGICTEQGMQPFDLTENGKMTFEIAVMRQYFLAGGSQQLRAPPPPPFAPFSSPLTNQENISN